MGQARDPSSDPAMVPLLLPLPGLGPLPGPLRSTPVRRFSLPWPRLGPPPLTLLPFSVASVRTRDSPSLSDLNLDLFLLSRIILLFPPWSSVWTSPPLLWPPLGPPCPQDPLDQVSRTSHHSQRSLRQPPSVPGLTFPSGTCPRPRCPRPFTSSAPSQQPLGSWGDGDEHPGRGGGAIPFGAPGLPLLVSEPGREGWTSVCPEGSAVPAAADSV